MLEVSMGEIKLLILISVCQIVFSIYLIVKRRNNIAIITEIISCVLMLCMLNDFSLDINNICFKYIKWTLLEYVLVKLFLVVFMLFARIYSFKAIKKMCNRRKKINKTRMKIFSKLYRVKYWPKLKLGIPAKAGKVHSVTKIKFDSKGFPKFKSYYTVKLRRKDYRKTREQHFYIANKILYKEILSNARLRAKFSKKEIYQLSNGETPNKYTWHHHQDAGVLQLVEHNIHSKTSHVGGYSIWGE